MTQEAINLEDLKDAVNLEDLKETVNDQLLPADNSAATITYTVQQDEFGRSYATGKRKDAVSRVWIKEGSGKITVNGRQYKNYFVRAVLQIILNYPFTIVDKESKFDVVCTVKGGGLSGQAGAIKHGISKALTYFNPDFRPALKRAGLLTRDSRVVERKKYGLRKARRSFQFSKR